MSVRRWNACNAGNSLYLREFEIFAYIIGAGAISRVPSCALYRGSIRSLWLNTLSEHSGIHIYGPRQREIKEKVIIVCLYLRFPFYL